MFYSESLNLLFIACPKTGSTSVEVFLEQLDPHGERHKITLGDRVIDSSMVKTDSLGHATAAELQEVLGEQRYQQMGTFGFARDPREKLVSSYFFVRNLSIREAFRLKTRKSKSKLVLKRVVNISVARALPFKVWALLFPMKRCANYFIDESGTLLVDGLGSIDRLGEDLVEILAGLGTDPDGVEVPHVNRSKHNTVAAYFRPGGLLERLIRRRYADYISLCELVADAPACGVRGKRIHAR